MSGTRHRAATIADTARAEMIKLVTLPATWLTSAGTFMITLVLTLAFAAQARQAGGPASILDVGLSAIGYTQAGFLIAGVLAATSEYGSLQVRTTLTGIPRRVELQIVKAGVLAAMCIPTAAAGAGTSVLVAHLTLPAATAPSGGRIIAAISGATGYLVLTAVSAASVATLLRRSLPATAILLGYYFVVGPLVRSHTQRATLFPDTAGRSMWIADAHGAPGVALSTLVVLTWAVAALVAATSAVNRRDA